MAETLYVSTDGRAGSPGTIEKPLPSLTAARDRIRELRKGGSTAPMTVLVRGGMYLLDEAFTLEPQDSGTKDKPVTYAAYTGERAVISGGRRITGWKKEGHRWTAPVNFEFTQLFIAGKRMMRARRPNNGYYRVDGHATQEKPMVFKFHGDTIQKSWAETGDVEVKVLCGWQEAWGRITKVDDAAHTVQLAAVTPRPAVMTHFDCYYSVENAPNSVDSQEEWQLDQKAGTVSFMDRARGPEDPNQEEAMAPVLIHLVQLKGEPEKGKLVHDLIFRGLDFRYSAWTLGENGYHGMQSAHTVPAAFEAEGAENVTVEHCMFAHLGNYGLSFGRGCFRNRVIGNEMVDIGCGGIKIGEPLMNRQRPNDAERNGGNLVADNHLHQLGRVYPSAAGILLSQSSDNIVSHNHIHDLFHNAISVGWTWQYKLTSLKNNIIEYNHLHDIGQSVMSDMGGIYTLGEQPGTILRNNLIHDVNALVYGGWGIYLDQATSNIIVEKNIIYNCNHAAFNQHWGREDLIRNNIFAFNPNFQMTRIRADKPVSLMLERNIIYFDEGMLLGDNWDGALKMNKNLYWDARGKDIRPAGKAWKDWQATGMDTDSVVADPMFVNPSNFDFRLKPGSPASKIGFQAIDMSTVGPRIVTGPAGIKKGK